MAYEKINFNSVVPLSMLAIDFGTSNTCVTRTNPVSGQSETLSIPGLSQQIGTNPPLIPSLVYVENAAEGKVLIGQQVRDRGYDSKNDPRFFRSFKRGIGANIQGFLPELDGQVITFEQIGTWFLTNLISQLGSIESLVLTVPVDSFESYRHWLGEACQTLPIEQVRMLDEPTAAALGYGMADKENLLVIDFGGGTLDLSLVRLDASIQAGKTPLGFLLKFGQKSLAEKSGQKLKTARVLAKAGQNLGGTDIDNWLVEYFATTQELAATSLTARLAERVKIQLSSQDRASEVYFDDETLDSYELELNRDTLETILKEHQFFEQLDECMTQLLYQARRQGLEIADINAVLLVGGTSQMPAVQNWVQKYFDPALISNQKPFEAIALGALQLTQGVEVKDFLYHSYGVRYWDRRNNRHNWHPLIKTGQPYPMQDPVELVLGASVESQPSIELIIGELGSETGATEVYYDGEMLITRRQKDSQIQVQPLNDSDGAATIAQLTPPGFPGSDRLRVLFYVDRQRFLRMTVEDLLTNQTLLEDRLVTQLS
ncbi:Hsp70 family protein [Chlorogloea sp. CCALA 695]|uniref:Hsp70 family protein n=1 Tax=Chlorogloea sp. CCALA 695 TaxID=2107693 RepID=UPI001E409090|nr:Hsp70 family protein [Chlorogloea sp. CCALA 695]